MSGVIRILSDLHYGDRGGRIRTLPSLMPLFEGVGTERLTRTVAVRRIGTPEDCARVVGFLAGQVVRVGTGAVIPIDGGSTT